MSGILKKYSELHVVFGLLLSLWLINYIVVINTYFILLLIFIAFCITCNELLGNSIKDGLDSNIKEIRSSILNNNEGLLFLKLEKSLHLSLYTYTLKVLVSFFSYLRITFYTFYVYTYKWYNVYTLEIFKNINDQLRMVFNMIGRNTFISKYETTVLNVYQSYLMYFNER